MMDAVHVWLKVTQKGLELEAVVAEDKSLELSEQVKQLFMSGAKDVWLPHERKLTGLYSRYYKKGTDEAKADFPPDQMYPLEKGKPYRHFVYLRQDDINYGWDG